MTRQLFYSITLLLLAGTMEAQSVNSRRILLPLPPTGEFAGGFGSVWEVELWAFNDSDQHVTVFRLPHFAGGDFEVTLGARSAQRQLPFFAPSELPEGTGAFLWFSPDAPLHFNLRVRELTSGDSWGTELPVVDLDEFQPVVHLLNIPISGEFRQTLRIYTDADVEPPISERLLVGVDVYSLEDGRLLDQREISVEPRHRISPDSVYAFVGYHRSSDIFDGLPAGAVRLEVRALSPGRLWGFVSITHNETQHVTTVTPQD